MLICELLTTAKACAYLGICRRTLNRWVKKGLPVYPVGGRNKFHPDDLDEWNRKEGKERRLPNMRGVFERRRDQAADEAAARAAGADW